MKPTPHLILLPAISLVLQGLSSAATFTWTNGDTTGLWSSTSLTTDWKSATVPNAAGSVVRYSLTPTASAAGTVTLDQAATIGIITQLTNSGGGNNGLFKIEKSGTNALTFDNTGGITNMWGTAAASIEFTGNGNTTDQLQVNPDIIIANTDLNIATISCGVRIGSSANNSAITATTNQNLILRGNAGTRALTINHSIGTAGAGTITLSNIGSATGVVTTIAGNLGAQVGSITQNGANTLVLSGTNSAFTGPTTITTGAIRYNAATALPAVGSGRTITVSSGGIASAGYAIDNTFLGRIVQSSAGTIALHVASGNALDFTGFASASLGATAAVTYSGALTPNAQAYRFGGGTATLTVSNNLNDSGGASSVTKTGTDTVILSGTNGYTNGTTISAGMLQFSKAAALPNYNTSSKVSAGNGGTLAVNYGGASDWTSSQVDALLSANGSGFVTGSALAFDTTNLSGSYASDITTTTLGLTKLGTNTLTLGGTNSYTGVTTITAGTLSVGSIGNGGVAGNLGQATAAASNLVFNGGTLKYTGANATSNRAFTINAGITATIDTTNNLSFAGATGTATTGSLTKTGNGMLTLTGVNTYGGTTTVSAGTLKIASGGSFTTTNATNTNSLLVGGTAGNSLLHIQSGGTGTATRLQIGTVNGGNGAIYNQGTLTVNGTANVANFALGFATGAYGYYRHDTSTTTTVNEIGIGTSSTTTTANLGGNGVMDVLQGKVANAGWFAMNRGDATQYSQLNISGGVFELANSPTQVGLFMNNNDTQNNKGGQAVINLSGTGSLTSAGTATELDLMRISQPTTATSMLGVLNIGTGGTVQTNVIKATQTNGTALVNFHGGMLKANNTGVTLMGGSNIDGAYVYSEGAIIDTNGKTVTISQNLLAPTGSGVSSIPVTANGTGYIGRPVVYLTGGGGTGATAVADFDPKTGQVTGITITNLGTGYTSAPTVTFTGGGGTAPTLGTVTIAANTSGGLTKNNTGTLTLSGTNTYTGDTTIKAGTLALSSAGTISNSANIIVGDAGSSGTVLDVTAKSAFTIGGSQALKGIGTVNIGAGKTITIDGTHSVGNAGTDGGVGNQTVTGNLSYGSTSLFEWDINTGTATYDKVALSGSLTVDSNAVFKVVSSTAFSDPFWSSTKSWIDIFGSNDLGFDVSKFLYVANGSSVAAPTTYGSFSISGSTLTWTAVPEPTSALAGLLITAGLLRRRRKF